MFSGKVVGYREIKLLEALGNLDLQPEWFASNGRRVNGSDECRTLLKVTSKLRERDSQIQSEPPLDPDAVWNLWSRNNFNIEVLDARQIRTLCLSAVTAVRPQFVRACNGQPAILSRTSCLLGIINAYSLEWGDIQDQSEVESLIRGGLSQYAKKNPVILHFRQSDLFHHFHRVSQARHRPRISAQSPRPEPPVRSHRKTLGYRRRRGGGTEGATTRAVA